MDDRLVLTKIDKIANFMAAAGEELTAIRQMALAGEDGAPRPDFRWDSPVGTSEERASVKLWPGGWFDATGYNILYNSSTNTPAYHTGNDLNNNYPRPYSDVLAPVYAPADAVVAFVGTVQGWQGKMVVLKVVLEDGTCRWPRLAHLGDYAVAIGQVVKRGDLIGHIGDYTPSGPAGDHLHYDIARKDIGAKPTDWPGMDGVRVVQDYENPLEFTRVHHV